MKLSELEKKRLSRVSAHACRAICDLNVAGDRLYAKGNDESRAKANELYIESDKIYTDQVLYRKFNKNKKETTMKMKQEHYAELKEIMEYGFTIKPQLLKKYKKHGWGCQSYVWDVYSVCVPEALSATLYDNYSNTDIEIALFKILKED